MASEKTKLRKISISATNNSLDNLMISDWVFHPLNRSYLRKLKSYVESKGFQPTLGSEKDFVIAALSWVSSQWIHDGINEPPKDFHALDILKAVHKKDARYRCVEYGIVLAELLQAYGFVARTLALRSNNVAYGGFGQGHVAMEVWLNDLQKWIFLDPQFGVFLSKDKKAIPLNYFEIYQEKKAGRYIKLIVNATDASKSFIKNTSDKISYKRFLKNYFGHIAVSNKEKREIASLLLEAKEVPLTFQANPLNNAVFTKRADLFYPEMNRVTLFVSYRSENKNLVELMKKLKIKTDKDYLNNMAKFAARPYFKVKIKSNSKLKESYQYRENDSISWKNLPGDQFKWAGTKKTNRLEVRSINQFGRIGPSTFLEIKYQ